MLSVNTLRPADIICSTTDAAISAVSRAGMGASVSHCMLYIGGSNVIEAVGHGVRSVGIDVALNGATLAIALRRRNLTPKQQSAVVAHASGFAVKNLPYDALGAAGAGVATGSKGAVLAGFGCGLYLPLCAVAGGSVADNARPENADKAFFCSELVARCFELAGAPVVQRLSVVCRAALHSHGEHAPLPREGGRYPTPEAEIAFGSAL